MKGLLFFLVLFFALCYSTDVYLTAYSAPSCDAATSYAVLKFNLTSGSCFNSDAGGGLLLNTDGSVSFFSSTKCSGNLSFSVASGSACTNGNFSDYQSYSQIVPSGVYIQLDSYQNQNCSTPVNHYSTYVLNATCFPANSTSFSYVAISASNIVFYYYSSSTRCSGIRFSTNFVSGCNAIGKSFLNIGVQNLPVLTTTGSSVTGTSVTGSSVTGTSVTESSVTGSSVTGSSSTTGASGSTTGSSSSNDSNVFYPSLFLLVSLFLTSLF